jgi:hypothetical protein
MKEKVTIKRYVVLNPGDSPVNLFDFVSVENNNELERTYATSGYASQLLEAEATSTDEAQIRNRMVFEKQSPITYDLSLFDEAFELLGSGRELEDTGS